MATYAQGKYCPTCKKNASGKKQCKMCGTNLVPGNWSVRFRFAEDGKLVYKRLSGFARKLDAEAAYRDYLATHEPSDVYMKEKSMTFRELYSMYLAYSKNRTKVSTRATLESVAEQHILPDFGHRQVLSLDKKDIMNWQRKLDEHERRYAFKYKSKMRSFFHAILRYGQRYHDLPRNVVAEVEPFRNTERRREMLFWTEDEFKQFIAIVDDRVYKAFFSFLYLTGARRGEALALEWKDIDLAAATVKICKQCDYHQPNTPYVIFDMPKNESSIRDILLPQTLVNLLKELKQNTVGTFVFNGARPMPVSSLARAFDAYAQKAGVKKIRIHDLRHSHASLLINKKQDILIIAKRLGHKNIEQTLNRYAHLYPNQQAVLINSLEIDLP